MCQVEESHDGRNGKRRKTIGDGGGEEWPQVGFPNRLKRGPGINKSVLGKKASRMEERE